MSLKAEEISFSYKQNPVLVLQRLSAAFHQKEIAAITGENGCGKTTLCKLLVGILKPVRGSIFVDGIDLQTLSLAETGRKIGYMMQNPQQQLFCKSVKEEITYGLNNLKLDQAEIEKRSNYFMDYFEIGQYQGRFPFQLSRGEKQRVILAAILAMEPQYLILDEPTASLDGCRQRKLGELLRKVRDDLNCGILLISHDRKFVKSYADRMLEMEKGGGLNVLPGNL